MNNNIGQQIAAILAMVIGVAIVAVLVGRNAQTSAVIQSAGTAFSQILGQAMSPVSGSGGGSTAFGGGGSAFYQPTGASTYPGY